MSNPFQKVKDFLMVDDQKNEESASEHLASAPKQNKPNNYSKPTLLKKDSPAAETSVSSSAFAQVNTFTPAKIEDAVQIGKTYREGSPVIINLSSLDDALALRFRDFASGLVLGLYGSLEKITNDVLILSPENIELNTWSEQKNNEVESNEIL